MVGCAEGATDGARDNCDDGETDGCSEGCDAVGVAVTACTQVNGCCKCAGEHSVGTELELHDCDVMATAHRQLQKQSNGQIEPTAAAEAGRVRAIVVHTHGTSSLHATAVQACHRAVTANTQRLGTRLLHAVQPEYDHR